MKGIIKATGFLTSAATWAVVLCGVLLTAALYGPRLFGCQPYVVLSGSMEPLIHTGSLVYIDSRDKDVQTDDIIAYERNDISVVHRVIEVTEEGYRTKGDANSTRDMGKVTESQVLGKYLFSIPAAGYLLSWIGSHTLRLGPVKVPLIILIAIGAILLLNALQSLLELAGDNNQNRGKE